MKNLDNEEKENKLTFNVVVNHPTLNFRSRFRHTFRKEKKHLFRDLIQLTIFVVLSF